MSRVINKALLRENDELKNSQTHLETILRQITGRDDFAKPIRVQAPANARSMVNLGINSKYGRATSIGENTPPSTPFMLDHSAKVKHLNDDSLRRGSKRFISVHNSSLKIPGIAATKAQPQKVSRSTQTPSFLLMPAAGGAPTGESTPLWNKSAGRFKSVSRITNTGGIAEDDGTPRSIQAMQRQTLTTNHHHREQAGSENSEHKFEPQKRQTDYIRLFLGSALATSVPQKLLSEFKTVLERYENKKARVEGLFFLIVRQAKRMIVTCGGESVMQKSTKYTSSPHIFVQVIMEVVMDKDIRQALPISALVLKELEMYKKLDMGCAYLLACITGNVGPLDQTSKLSRLGHNSEGSLLAGKILEIEGIMMLGKLRMQDLKDEEPKERSSQSQEHMELISQCEEIVFEKVKSFERFASGLQQVLDALHNSETNEESELWQAASIQHAILNLEEILKVLLFSLAKAEFTSKSEGFSRKQRFSDAWVAEICKWILPELILIRCPPNLPFRLFLPLLYPYLSVFLSLGSQSSHTLNHSDDYFRCNRPDRVSDLSMETYYKHLLRS